MKRRVARPVAATAAVLALAGCSAAGSGGSSHSPPAPRLAALIAKAHLQPCPASSPRQVKGGLPDVVLHCLGEGPAVHLGGLVGKPTVVNLWGSWCVPCQAEAAILSSVYRADRSKVRFLGVDTEDSADSALDFGAHVSPPVRYPSVVDPERKVLLGLAKAPGPPQTAFVNARGVVVHVHVGPYTDAAALRADLRTYLQVQ